jgi:GntR family transcriptional regulator
VDVDRRADRSLYLQLADVLRDQIHRGVYSPGERLPSESALIADHDVSRGTVRDAIGVLRSEGLVVVEHGRGAYVRNETSVIYTRHLNTYAGMTLAEAFTADAEAQGFKPSIRNIDPALLDGLTAMAGSSVVGMLCFVDGRVVQAAVMWADLSEAADVAEKVRARMPTRGERRLLQLDDGVPVFDVQRQTTTNGEAERARAILPTDRVELAVGDDRICASRTA